MAVVRERFVVAVEQTSTTLTEPCGIGLFVGGGGLVAEAENVARFLSRDHFAPYKEAAPIDATSAGQVRHRLTRIRNRRITHARQHHGHDPDPATGQSRRSTYERNDRRARHPRRMALPLSPKPCVRAHNVTETGVPTSDAAAPDSAVAPSVLPWDQSLGLTVGLSLLIALVPTPGACPGLTLEVVALTTTTPNPAAGVLVPVADPLFTVADG